jgi:hypothetical protein
MGRMGRDSSGSKPGELRALLDNFFDLFNPSVELAEKLISAKSSPQEIILLMCARLDALACSIVREDEPNRAAFIRLLVNYAGYRDLMQSVSIGDLYYELGYHRWLVEGLIPKPGRLHRFSGLNDPVIELLERSGIPLTAEAAERFLSRAMRALRRTFRCTPGQPKAKPHAAALHTVIDALEAEFRRSRDAELRSNLKPAFQPLLDRQTVAAILYERFRNNAVHGLRVEVDERNFFAAQEPYWNPLYSDYYPPFLLLMFPAAFLVRLLRNSLTTVRHHFAKSQKLPPDVHFHVFGFGIDYLEFLDDQLLPKGRDLRLRIR